MSLNPPGARSILLVEDSLVDRELVERRLREAGSPTEPVTLTVVTEAGAALDAVRRTAFSVVLIDSSLNGHDGLDLLGEIRTVRQDVPVVLLTGSGDEGVAVTALQRGAADYVIKQLGFERALPVVIDRVLDKRAAEQHAEATLRESAQRTQTLERRLMEQDAALERARRDSEVLRAYALDLATTRTLGSALTLAARAAGELLRADAAAVALRPGREPPMASYWGSLAPGDGQQADDVPDGFAHEFGASAAAPLRSGQGDIGLVWAGRLAARPFDAAERALLDAVARLTAAGIENVHAHERLRQLGPRTGSAPTDDPV